MILFKEKSVLENLSSDLLRRETFMEDLATRKHTGYVILKGREEFLLLFSEGVMKGCFDMNGLSRKQEDAFANARSIDVVTLSDTVYASFLYVFFGRKGYSGLRCDFIDIKKFLQDLGDKSFSGVIEVEGESKGYILMEGGVPQDSFLTIEGKVRHRDALTEVLSIAGGASMLSTYELSSDRIGLILSFQRKVKFVYDKMKAPFGGALHILVERRTRDISEHYPLFSGFSISKEGSLHIPYVEERHFLREEEISSSFNVFIQMLLSCVSEIAGEQTASSFRGELEKM